MMLGVKIMPYGLVRRMVSLRRGNPIVSGSANPGLASAVANYLGVDSDGCTLERYPTAKCVPSSKMFAAPMFT
jgi:hypothetical protein